MAGRHGWEQCELKIMAGAEAWILVRHRRGAFKLPLDASAEDLIEGVRAGWTMSKRTHDRGDLTVQLRLAHLRALEAARWPTD